MSILTGGWGGGILQSFSLSHTVTVVAAFAHPIVAASVSLEDATMPDEKRRLLKKTFHLAKVKQSYW